MAIKIALFLIIIGYGRLILFGYHPKFKTAQNLGLPSVLLGILLMVVSEIYSR